MRTRRIGRILRRGGFALLLPVLLAASLVVPVSPSTGVDLAEPIITLRVMTFNIWYGATVTDGLDEVVGAIQMAGADVVGMQEPYARLRRIADALGYYVSPRMHVISRYPILEPHGSDGEYAYLLLAPGRVAAIANTHLPCCPYTPYRIVNRGFDRSTVLDQERRTRLRRIGKHLTALAPLLDAGIPTFFTGDFNVPSHRDWTSAVAEARRLPYAVRWPVSLAMEAAGFRDSYRDAHPDPLVDPGFTWTPGYPAPFLTRWEVHDRIDFVWAFGPSMTVDSAVVGESAANADIVITPYPTDHRGVVSTFEVTPAPAPVLASADGERSRPGLPLDVWFHGPAASGRHLALVPAGSTSPVADRPADGADGVVTFETDGLDPGTYDVLLLDASGAELAGDTVVLVEFGQPPELVVTDDTLEGSQPLEVSWRWAPGNRFDWLAIFEAGVSAKDGPFARWRYVDAAIEGTTTLGPRSPGPADWPLPPGAYEVRLCLDDSYRCRVSTPFTVEADGYASATRSSRSSSQ